MSQYVFFNISTGKISKVISTREADTGLADLNRETGEDWVEITNGVEVSGALHYVTNTASTKDITARPDFDSVASWSDVKLTADNVDTVTFGSGLPNPTSVTIIGQLGIPPLTGSVTDGTLTITVPLPGPYQVTLEAFPYKTETYIITGI